MHPDLKILIELQQVDRNISELTSKLDSSPLEIQALQAQLNEFTRTLDELKSRLSANQKERRDLEGDLQTIRAKISRHKDQLYEVKTNEQYRAMLKEIEGEEENIRKVEDCILEKMVEAEQIDKLIREALGRLDSEKARVQNEVSRLEALRRESEQARNQARARREELARSISEETLGLYEKLRKARNGMALAEVRDGLCTGCHVRLRPQAYNDVRSSDLLLTCEACSRILYYIRQSESAAGDEMANDQRAAFPN